MSEGRIGPVQLGPVRLVLPPDAQLSRTVRLAVSGMAATCGFTVDEVDDIKVAVSEILISLIEHGDGAEIELELAVDDAAFRIDGRAAISGFDPAHPDLALSKMVLDSTCSANGVSVDHGVATLWAIVTRATAT